MRSGEEYRDSLRDGRKVWVVGVGAIDDLTSHPVTAPMVDFYAAWYDRHLDPSWQDTLLTGPDAAGQRHPLAFHVPETVEELRRLSHSISAVSFKSAGNVTHTPGYGHLIAMGIVDALRSGSLPADRIAAAEANLASLQREGRFLTFCSGGPPVSDRFRSPEDRGGLRVLRETDGGVVLKGMVGMHTAVPFADEVFVAGAVAANVEDRIWFSLAVGAPGVQVIARKPAAREANPFLAPLSSRFDELDAQLWLDDVFVPWEKVFARRIDPNSATADPRRHEGVTTPLLWHQQLGWLARAEFTTGLALALFEAMGLRGNVVAVDRLTDLLVDLQTIRTCVTAAELDAHVTPGGFLLPRLLHLAPAAIHNLKVRQHMSELLRNIGASSMVVAPSDTDLADAGMGAGFEASLGGGGFTAKQRAALLHLASDHVSSALDGRESSFELLANGGMPVWRGRIQRWFNQYDELANGVLEALDVEMPVLNVRLQPGSRPS